MLPDAVNVMRASELELSRHDLVCFAVPAAALPAAVAAHGGAIPQRTGVLVMSKGLVPPLGMLPSSFVAERVNAWAVGALAGPSHAAGALSDGASLIVGASDPAFGRQVTDALGAAGFDAGYTRDVVGIELAGCAKNAAALAAAAASPAGPNASGAAAGKVFAEVDALARHEGSQPETFAGPGRHGRPRRHRARRRLAQPPRRRAARAAACRPRTSTPRSATPPRASPACRCCSSGSTTPASTPPRCAAWPA